MDVIEVREQPDNLLDEFYALAEDGYELSQDRHYSG